MTEQLTSESVSAQRDRANAEAAEAWQRVAELESFMSLLCDAIDPENYPRMLRDARALLAKGSKP